MRREGRTGRLLLIALAACGEQPKVAPVVVPPPEARAVDAGPPPPPREGTACETEAKDICLAADRALGCHGGKWEAMRCTSCEKECEQTTSEVGEVCAIHDDYLCVPGGKAMMTCNGSYRWTTVQKCLGERGCVPERKKITCDNSIANAGDACVEDDDYACSTDGKIALVCRGRVFTMASRCNGKKACRIVRDETTRVECDDSIAAIGDPCEKEGHYSCAPDGKSIVRCVAKKFVQDDKCKKKETCQVRAEQVGCY